ncbi:hypothetical protein [Levilactobacillus acidifarinae]|nr:hypothetical protein [Levilactobacillus acidifarinae]
MEEQLKTPAVWIDPSFVEHATGEVIHLAPQYLEAPNYETYFAALRDRHYTLIPQANGGLKALAPLRNSRSQVSTITLTPVDEHQPRTPAQQLAYEQRDDVVRGQLIGSAD